MTEAKYLDQLRSFRVGLRASLNGAIAQRLIRGMSWSVLGGGTAAASSLLAGILVARMLGPEKFGALGLIQSTLNTFVIFVGPAVGLTATKFIAEHRERQPVFAGRVLGLTIVAASGLSATLSVILIAASHYLAANVYHASFLAPLLRIAAAALFLSGVNGAQTGALAGVEAFGSIASANLVKGLATLPLMWFGTKYLGVEGAVLALVAAALIGCIMSEWLLRRALRKASLSVLYRSIWANASLLVTFSFPAILTSGMVLVAMWLGNVLLVRQPGGYSEFGIFNAANQWRTVILFLPSMIVQPFLPILSGLTGGGDLLRFRKVLVTSVALCAVAAFVPAVGAIVLSKQIMSAYGSAFSHAALTLILVVTATLLAAPTLAVNQGLNSLGKAWASAGIHSIWVLIFLGTLLMTVKRGAEGLALAYTVGYLTQILVFAWYIRVRLPVLGRPANLAA
jgi:O-antigen/teichoic acid export membrane protein